MKYFLFIIAGFAFYTIACEDKNDPVQDDVDYDAGEPVTYTEHVKPILDAACISCHSTAKSGADRNGAPVNVNFDTYELSVENAEAANSQIQRGRMPLSGALPDDQQALFDLWVKTGTKE